MRTSPKRSPRGSPGGSPNETLRCASRDAYNTNELDITKDGIDRHEANNNDTPLASTRSRDIAVFLDVVRAAHYIPRIGFGLAQMSLGLRDQRWICPAAFMSSQHASSIRFSSAQAKPDHTRNKIGPLPPKMNRESFPPLWTQSWLPKLIRASMGPGV